VPETPEELYERVKDDLRMPPVGDRSGRERRTEVDA
jgi:hypothetical protein